MKRVKAIIPFLFAWLASFGGVTDTTTVSLSPATLAVAKDSLFTLSVSVDSITSLFSFATDISFDAGQLQVISVTEGNFLSSNGTVSTSLNKIVSSDKIIIGLTRLGAENGGVSSSVPQVLLSIKFKKLTTDTITIAFSNTGLLLPDGTTTIPNKTVPCIVNGFAEGPVSALLSISPDVQNAVKNDLFSVSLDVDSAYGLFAYAADINYDPHLARFVSSDEGLILDEGGAVSTSFIISADTIAGKITVGHTRLGALDGLVIDDAVTLSIFTFRKLTYDTLELNLSDYGLLKNDGVTEISAETENGKCYPSGSPVSASAAELVFGNLAVNDSTGLAIRIYNNSVLNPVSITDLSYGTSHFFDHEAIPFDIAEEDSATVNIWFRPDIFGNYNDILTISCLGESYEVPLSGISPVPDIEVSENPVVFGTVSRLAATERSVNVNTTTVNELIIDSIYNNNPRFTVAPPEGRITSTEDLLVSITHRPFGAGLQKDTLFIRSNGSPSLMKIPVTAVTPPLAPPQSLEVIATTSNQLTIRWNQNHETDFMRYRIYFGTATDEETPQDSTSNSSLDTTRVLTGLINDQTYFIYVTAVDSSLQESIPGNEVTGIPVPPPAAPVAKAAENILQTSFTAGWNSSPTADGYRLDIAADGDFTTFLDGFEDKDEGIATTADITGLTSNTSYYYRVRAYNEGGISDYSDTVEVVTLPDPPSAPVADQPSDMLQNSFTASWSSSPTATGYRIDLADDPGFTAFVDSYNNIDAGNVTTLNITGLNAATTYYFRVRAYNTGGFSDYSETITVITLPDPPSAPVANQAENIVQTGFTANWNSSPSATGYRLDVATDNTFTLFVAAFNDKDVSNITSLDITGLDENTTYYYRVRAYNTGGNSDYSDIVTTTTLSYPPDAPVANQADNILQTSFTAGWADSPSATGYRLDVASDAEFTSFVAGYNDKDIGNVVTISVTGLTASMTYYYRARAYNTGGFSGYSDVITVITLPDPPSAPVANQAENIVQTGFTANWNSSPSATGYRLDIATDNGFVSFITDYNDKDVTNVITLNVTGLIQNTTYYYRIRAYNTGGTSDYSNTVPVTTLPDPPEAPVADPADNIFQTSFRANWNSSATATGYQLDVAKDDGFISYVPDHNNKDIGNVTDFVVSGLNAGTTYYYRIRSYNNGGISPNSDTIPVTTAEAPVPPSIPVALDPTDIHQSGFTANWTSVSDATGYRLDVSTENTFSSFITDFNNRDVGNVTSASVYGLDPNTIYYYRIRAYNPDAISDYSVIIEATTLPLVPSAPVATSASNRGTTFFKANWDSSPSATGYLLDLATDIGFTTFFIQNYDVGNYLFFDLSFLSANTTYYYRLKAYNTGGFSDFSNTITVTTLPYPPLAPEAIQPDIVLQTSFMAKWNSSATADGYQLDVATDDGFVTFVTDFNNKDIGNVTSYVVSGLTAGTTYYYRLRAYNNGGVSLNSGTITATTSAEPVQPSVPDALEATDILPTGFHANWTGASNATGYYLDVSTENTFASFVTDFNGRDVGNATSATVYGLSPNTVYFYRIRAYNSDGISDYSETISVNTLTDMPVTPEAILAENVLQTSFTARWNISVNSTGYLLDLSADIDFGTFIFQNYDVGNVLSFEISGLIANTAYYYRLRAYNYNGTGEYTNIITTVTLHYPPAAPVAGQADNVLQTSFRANWTISSTADYYLLDVANDFAFNSFVAGYNGLFTDNVTSYVVSGLAATSTYYYRVRAFNNGGTSGNSATITVTTASEPVPPGIPVALDASGIGQTLMTAVWNSSANATGYRLDVSADNTFSTFVTDFQDRDVGNVTSFEIYGLVPATTYFYRVIAYNPDGVSNYSEIIDTETLMDPPAAPVADAATDFTNNSFTANWQSSATATGYKLDVATDIDFTSYATGFNDTDVGDVISADISGLDFNTTYYYRVKAYNSGGNSSYSNAVSVITVQDPPEAPVALVADNILQTGFSAMWESSETATGYMLDVSEDNAFSTYINDFNSKDVGNITSYDVAGLSAGTVYYYRVRAYNSRGTGSFSGIITTTTLPLAPSPPSANPASNPEINGFTANWEISQSATGYYLDVAADIGFVTFVNGYNNKDAGNVISFNISGLSSKTTYYYRVRAYNTGGTSNNSNIVTTATLPDLPYAPVATKADNITQSGFRAHWDISVKATGYLLDIATDNAFTSYVSGYIEKDVSNILSYSVTGLSAKTTYFYRVRAYNTDGTGDHSNIVAVTTLSNPSSVPAGVTASSCNDLVTLKWRKGTGPYFSKYYIYGGFSATPTVIIDSTSNGISDTTIQISGLSRGNVYYFRVTSVNIDGPVSAYSNTVMQMVKTGVIPRIRSKWDNVLICNNVGDSIKSFQWYKNETSIPDAVRQFYMTSKQSGVYKVETIDLTGCKNSSKTISITGAKSISVYPNPVSVSFSLKMNEFHEGSALVSILNTSGIKVMEFRVNSFSDELLKDISVDKLDEGVYILQVLLENDEFYSVKIIVAK